MTAVDRTAEHPEVPLQASAERVIPAARDLVWAFVADPSRHRLFDGTGTVGAPASDAPLAEGARFRMDMTYRHAGGVDEYRTDNLVTRLEPGRCLRWATAVPDGEPLGWTWTYELDDDDAGTRVVLTYDWTRAPEEHLRRYGVPIVGAEGLAASLALLDEACRAAGPGRTEGPA